MSWFKLISFLIFKQNTKTYSKKFEDFAIFEHVKWTENVVHMSKFYMKQPTLQPTEWFRGINLKWKLQTSDSVHLFNDLIEVHWLHIFCCFGLFEHKLFKNTHFNESSGVNSTKI